MALSLYSGLAPSVWEHEDPRALATALEMLAERLEAEGGKA